jgi:TPR repeat protein
LGDPYADTGISYLQKLSKSGLSDAQFVLGQAYADDGRYDTALSFFLAATKRNHYDAAYEAGCLCERGGSGLRKNEREALNYYRKAGISGHKKAMYRLALAELYGQLGLKRNINNGMKWLNRGEAGNFF